MFGFREIKEIKSPDTRVEWLAMEASQVIDEAWNEAMNL